MSQKNILNGGDNTEFSQKILMEEPNYTVYMVARNLNTVCYNADGTITSEFVIRIPIQIGLLRHNIRAEPCVELNIQVSPSKVVIDERSYFAYLTYYITTDTEADFSTGGRIYYNGGNTIAHFAPSDKFSIIQIKNGAVTLQMEQDNFHILDEEEGWEVWGYCSMWVWTGPVDLDSKWAREDGRCFPRARLNSLARQIEKTSHWAPILNSKPPLAYRHLFHPANLDYTLKNGFTLKDGYFVLKNGFANSVPSVDDIISEFINSNY